MKKTTPILILAAGASCFSSVFAQQSTDDSTTDKLSPIIVEGKKIEEVKANEVKSADLAEVLNKTNSNISLVRRSGIANDIILRGQKKDNINILIDDAKIYGACPNRMDPPTSHVLNNNIENINIIEGPFDVINFGTLSGLISIETVMPEQEFKGQASLNLGSWDYQKLGASVSGGSDTFRALVSVSQETAGQYEDGDGNTMADQLAETSAMPMPEYKSDYEDMDAYEKRTFMGKVFVLPSDNQELEISLTANRSDDILYPSTPMDAIRDDSDIVNVNYSILELGEYFDALEFQVYRSSVEHPMSTFYRNSSGTDSANEVISYVETEAQGFKIINENYLESGTELKYGVDLNTRNWDGEYEGFGMNSGITGTANIPDAETENQAVFLEVNTGDDVTQYRFGLRLDDTTVSSAIDSLDDNDYSNTSAFAQTRYHLDNQQSLYAALGRASRVPDGRELYFQMKNGMMVGNPELDETVNTELDLGYDFETEGSKFKVRIYQSKLKDFIHYNSSLNMNMGGFENVDATIHGLELSGNYSISNGLTVDYGLAYAKGKKEDNLTNQTDKDLAEMPPMKLTAGLNFDYNADGNLRVELIAADKWSDFDEDNGEQELDSWNIMNVKVKHRFTDQFTLVTGIDNLFDETYAVSNTYKDLKLLTDGDGDVMLLNEPGRYIYINGVYSF